MKTIKISENENFKFLKDLSQEIEEKSIFIINNTLTESDNSEFLISAESAMCEILNTDWYNLIRALVSENLKTILYKGELHLIKDEVDKLKDYIESSEFKKENEKISKNYLSNPSLYVFPVGKEIISFNYSFKRSYFIDVETTLKTLNIGFSELNKLINDGVLRVILSRIKVYFYSYQVEEVLHILKEGEEHKLEW